MVPQVLLTLRYVRELAFIEDQRNGGYPQDVPLHDRQDNPLRIGAMTTHREVERSATVRRGLPILAYTFSLVASPRVRNQATVGGVLADADYASDPPTMLNALNARAVARSLGGEREIPIEELITGYYETSLRPDELLTEVRIPCFKTSRGCASPVERAVYRKFRSRSSEDRPCVAVAATLIDGKLRVVVGAVAERPQYFPDICDVVSSPQGDRKDRPYGEQLNREVATEIGRRYAEAIQPISDSRGSAEYRRRVIAVEVRRALEEMMP
jgi:carbon-monoxide dehydrogenase medium subunit